nr:immunoglobulin heavy chain junction region [Mus musculus]
CAKNYYGNLGGFAYW